MDASSKNKAKTRLGWLDFGKAMGILVVLMVHAECRLGLVTYYGGMFYMPVFFVAAGYTYRCKKEESYGTFLRKKAKRLLVPYFESSAFLWLFFWLKDSVLGGKPMDLKLFSILGIFYSRNQMFAPWGAGESRVLLNLLNAPLWFLTAMFLVYAYYDGLSRSKKKYSWLALGLGIAMVWHYTSYILLPWSFEAVPYFACFFAAGELLRERGGEKILKDVRILGASLILFLACTYANGSVNLSVGNYGRSMLLYLVVGSTGSVLVFAIGAWMERICPRLVSLTGWIGQETLVILCFHMFLFMFIRTAASVLGLGEGVTRAALVAGSVVLLTLAGRIRRKRKCNIR